MIIPPVHGVIVVGVLFDPQFIIFIYHLVQSDRPIFGRLGGLLVKRGRCWDFQTHFFVVLSCHRPPLIGGDQKVGGGQVARAWIVGNGHRGGGVW